MKQELQKVKQECALLTMEYLLLKCIRKRQEKQKTPDETNG